MALWIALSADLNQILAFILSGAVASHRDLWSFPSDGSHPPDPGVCVRVRVEQTRKCQGRGDVGKPPLWTGNY